MTRPSVLVVGASRGIGLELVRQHRAAGDDVVATARSDDGLARLTALGARALRLDVTSLESTAGLAWQLDGHQFQVVWICAGVLASRSGPLATPTQREFDEVMHTNVLGPLRVVAQVADALAPDARLVVLSSRMGSIGGRSTADSSLYRASKAALNSFWVDTARALAGRAVCVAVHPGWVQTDMGGAGASLTVEASVVHLRRLLAELRPEDTGRFLDHDGRSIPW